MTSIYLYTHSVHVTCSDSDPNMARSSFFDDTSYHESVSDWSSATVFFQCPVISLPTATHFFSDGLKVVLILYLHWDNHVLGQWSTSPLLSRLNTVVIDIVLLHILLDLQIMFRFVPIEVSIWQPSCHCSGTTTCTYRQSSIVHEHHLLTSSPIPASWWFSDNSVSSLPNGLPVNCGYLCTLFPLYRILPLWVQHRYPPRFFVPVRCNTWLRIGQTLKTFRLLPFRIMYSTTFCLKAYCDTIYIIISYVLSIVYRFP